MAGGGVDDPVVALKGEPDLAGGDCVFTVGLEIVGVYLAHTQLLELIKLRYQLFVRHDVVIRLHALGRVDVAVHVDLYLRAVRQVTANLLHDGVKELRVLVEGQGLGPVGYLKRHIADYHNDQAYQYSFSYPGFHNVPPSVIWSSVFGA